MPPGRRGSEEPATNQQLCFPSRTARDSLVAVCFFVHKENESMAKHSASLTIAAFGVLAAVISTGCDTSNAPPPPPAPADAAPHLDAAPAEAAADSSASDDATDGAVSDDVTDGAALE
jgi:hypothetical protein